VLARAVFTPASGHHYGALAGTCLGGSGSASLGVGVGANALIGGSHQSIALQPLSVKGHVGVNLALRVALPTICSIELRDDAGLNVRFWYKADITIMLNQVRFRG
jgi:hypothetical protein